MTITEDRFVFVPLEKATVPPSGLIEHIKDRWWMAHPEKGLVFFDKKAMAPQCNSSEKIARHFASAYPWATVVFVPSVFRTINPNDYAH